MAKKQEKEVERWVTVNGARVPIFKDGSIGGPKELRDKLKAHQDKKSIDKDSKQKETKKPSTDTQTEQSVKKPSSKRFKKSDYEKSEKYVNTITSKRDFYTGEAVDGPSAIKQVSDKLENDFGPLSSGRRHYESDFRSETYYTQLKDKSNKVVAIQRDEHDRWKNYSDAILTDYGRQVLSNKSSTKKETIKQTEKSSAKNDSEYKPKYYTESELKDEKFRKDALEEMNRYERNWSSYSLKERRNISPNGVKELRNRIKEIENYEKASKANTIKANDDLKEKQIARNKAEKDAISSDKSVPKYKIKDDYENADDYRKGVLRKQFENNSDPYKLRPGVLYTDEQIAYNKAASDNWKKEREKYMAAKEKKAKSKEFNDWYASTSERDKKIYNQNKKLLEKMIAERGTKTKAGDVRIMIDFDKFAGTNNKVLAMLKREGYEILSNDGETVYIKKKR